MSAYLTTKQIAELIGVADTKYPRINVHKFLKRYQVPTVGNGRVLALKVSVIEALEQGRDQRKARARRAS